jgi:hypothetical protein
MKTKFENFLNENLRQDKIKDMYKREIQHLNAPIKKKINKDIREVTKPTYFDEIPLDELFAVLDKYGIVPVMEDNTYWSGFLLGEDSNTIFNLADKMSSETRDDITFYTPYENAGLWLSWHMMENGRYEIVSYVS